MDTRQKILNAAAELIVEEGLDTIRTSKIAKRAGVADGAMYRHFESKEVLIAEVYKDVAKDIDAQLNPAILEKGDLKERFFHYWEEPFAFFIEHPERFILFDTLDKTVSIKMADKASALESSLKIIGQVFAEGQAKGLMHEEVNPDQMIAAIYGALSQLVYKAHSGSFAVTRGNLRAILNVFWDGIS